MNGPFYRLDDMLDRAVVKQEPPPIAAEHTVVGALEFDDPAKPDLKPAQGGPATSMRDGVLEVVSDPDDYLENAVELAVPRDEIGDLVIRMKADNGTYHAACLDQCRGAGRRQDLAGEARRALHRPPRISTPTSSMPAT